MVLAAAVGVAAGYGITKLVEGKKIQGAKQTASLIIEEARREAEAKKREMLVEVREEVHQLRSEAEKETRERRAELARLERRLIQKEESLDRKLEGLEKRELALQEKERELGKARATLEELRAKQLAELERLSGLSSEEARELLLKNLEHELEHEMAVKIKEAELQAREEAEKRAREIVAAAIEKCAADYVAEATVSVIPLPSDEMKGRIIGREGRNIRSLETLTGVDLIIDDTPEAVILSGFDPIRREVARIALEKLISDGRIHPARIEEMVQKAQKQVEEAIRDEGERIVLEMGITGIHPELIRLLGRLKYRSSYGQNVLKHSLEVAHLAGHMAAELGADASLAKRAGLLHDIGKGADNDAEGPHVALGVELLRKYKESPEVIHIVHAHHGDVDPRSIEAVLVQ
ncbi:MAG: ribonuclease Y, partial [Clostridia bacterium]|nr:ribonuclease Y [Clostridia bacterium]